MHYLNLHAALAVAFIVGSTCAVMARPMSDMVLLQNESAVAWGPPPASLPKGLQFSVLAGNPDKPGPFTLRIRMPAHFVIAPHTHATSENLTVLSGSIMHDMGNTRVIGRGKELDAAGFVFLPGNTPHSL